MAETTARLGLPLILAAQAQKHVTHNEALAALDLLVQASLEARDAETPPADPAEGAAWGLGAAPTGAWAGQAGKVAQWRDGGWIFVTPAAGWRAWDRSAAALVLWDGSGWTGIESGLGGTALQNLEAVGVGTTADDGNRLAVASDGSLFSHAGTDHRVTVNKAAAADTATLLFQSGWSGRAEIGLAGGDDLAIKVSADGSAWTTALAADAATGAVALGSGLTVGGAEAYHRGNLLGSVGQSGGVPTGAVIEAGSSGDGSYTRFADGTQVCLSPTFSADTDTAAGALWRQAVATAWSFPAGFAAPPAVASGGLDDPSLAWVATGAATVTGATACVWAVASGTGRSFRLTAIGRWF